MQKNIKNITFKFSALVLVLALLIPTLVKFNHVFEAHVHEVCHGEKQTHLHTADVDCEFYKFQLNHHFTLPFNFIEVFIPQENFQIIISQYFFLSEYQQLHFCLRGPPELV
ncbi:hypothetical protein [Formosa sp. S-31]|uniref:hypothetical protein n=1 Tax=Formosa sp. S-31 TaxID=2790949 RepID=UPI003EB85638